MRYFLDGTWAAIASTLSRLRGRRNAGTAMAFHLQSLLDLRSDAEKAAKAAFELVAAARAREDREQARLVAEWQSARSAREQATARWTSAPANAGQALTREQYRGRLDHDVARAARIAQEHRAGPLATATKSEDDARAACQEARLALEAILKVKGRAEAEEAQRAERRAEDEASDHANAAFARRRRP